MIFKKKKNVEVFFPIEILRRSTWNYKYINLHISWPKLTHGETHTAALTPRLNERNTLKNITKKSKHHKTQRIVFVWHCASLHALSGLNMFTWFRPFDQCCSCSFRHHILVSLGSSPSLSDRLVFLAGTW